MGPLVLTCLEESIDLVHPVQFRLFALALFTSLLNALDFEIQSGVLRVDATQGVPLAQSLGYQILLLVLTSLEGNGVDQVASFAEAAREFLKVRFVRVSLQRFLE